MRCSARSVFVGDVTSEGVTSITVAYTGTLCSVPGRDWCIADIYSDRDMTSLVCPRAEYCVWTYTVKVVVHTVKVSMERRRERGRGGQGLERNMLPAFALSNIRSNVIRRTMHTIKEKMSLSDI